DGCIVSFGPLNTTLFKYVFVEDYEQYSSLQKLSHSNYTNVLNHGDTMESLSTQPLGTSAQTVHQPNWQQLVEQNLSLNEDMAACTSKYNQARKQLEKEKKKNDELAEKNQLQHNQIVQQSTTIETLMSKQQLKS